jgi:hypothetical protein
MQNVKTIVKIVGITIVISCLIGLALFLRHNKSSSENSVAVVDHNEVSDLNLADSLELLDYDDYYEFYELSEEDKADILLLLKDFRQKIITKEYRELTPLVSEAGLRLVNYANILPQGVHEEVHPELLMSPAFIAEIEEGDVDFYWGKQGLDLFYSDVSPFSGSSDDYFREFFGFLFLENYDGEVQILSAELASEFTSPAESYITHWSDQKDFRFENPELPPLYAAARLRVKDSWHDGAYFLLAKDTDEVWKVSGMVGIRWANNEAYLFQDLYTQNY